MSRFKLFSAATFCTLLLTGVIGGGSVTIFYFIKLAVNSSPPVQPVDDFNHGLYYSLAEDSVTNGNSLIITRGTTEMTIDLCGVDAPDLEEPLGIEARDHLKLLASQGQGQLIVVSRSSPTEQRTTVAEVTVPLEKDEISLNTRMLASGMARIDSEKISDCLYREQYLIAEGLARQQKLGIWAKPFNTVNNATAQ